MPGADDEQLHRVEVAPRVYLRPYTRITLRVQAYMTEYGRLADLKRLLVDDLERILVNGVHSLAVVKVISRRPSTISTRTS